VPRHPQRFDEVAALVVQSGFTVARRSAWTDTPAPGDVWIGDSLGEMALYYAMADVALLGGSFAPLGGQNLIEAAACGCPIVMGPHTFNFSEAAELALEAGAARRVGSMEEGVRAAVAMAREVPSRKAAAEAGERFAAAHRGAAAKTAEAVLGLLAR
jgi:3-deoxy-D-manno-octulosonic-acid transferase